MKTWSPLFKIYISFMTAMTVFNHSGLFYMHMSLTHAARLAPGLATAPSPNHKDNYKQNFEKYPVLLPHFPKSKLDETKVNLKKIYLILVFRQKMYSFYDTGTRKNKKFNAIAAITTFIFRRKYHEKLN